MAEVVRSNFSVLLPLIEDCIKRSEFLAVDTEFTGLTAQPSDEPREISEDEKMCSDIYNLSVWRSVVGEKISEHLGTRLVRLFSATPPGLSAFVKDPDANKYIAHSFSFYLFPRPQGNLDCRIGIQASSAEFLCDHRFDFNKVFHEGIPYLNSKQIGELFAKEETPGETEYQEALGFTRVFRAIKEAHKPVLGHNMLNDVMLMYEKFHEPLPERYTEFKEKLHNLFPVIIDTKHLCYGLRRYLAESNLLEFSSLIDLYEALGSQRGTFYVLCTPDVCHAEESQKYNSERNFHEAGFDAFCVGFIFLRIAHLVAMKGIKSSDAHPVHLKQYFHLMERYTNRINIIRGPTHFIDLSRPDPPPVRSEWLVVTSRNREPVSLQMLQDHLGDFMTMDVQFISPYSALVCLASRRRALQVLSEATHLHTRRYYWILDSPAGKLVWRVSFGALGLGLGLSLVLLRFAK